MDYGVLNKLIESVTNNFNNLSTNIIAAAGRVTDAANKIDNTVSDLNKTIQTASASADKQASAMRWLTAALVTVGFLQIFLPLFFPKFYH